MGLDTLSLQLEEKLRKNFPSGIFLDKMRVLDESSRLTSAYTDPHYIPFFYWLGTLTQPKSLLEIGFRLGLTSGNFLRGCKTVERFLAFQQQSESFYSPRLGRSNVKDHYKKKFDIYVGNLSDESFDVLLSSSEWDLVLINEELSYDRHLEYLETVWTHLSIDGMIFMDYITRHKPAEEAYMDFCKAKSRKPVIIKTRYGVGACKK